MYPIVKQFRLEKPPYLLYLFVTCWLFIKADLYPILIYISPYHLFVGAIYHNVFFPVIDRLEFRLWRCNMIDSKTEMKGLDRSASYNALNTRSLIHTPKYVQAIVADRGSFYSEGHKHTRKHTHRHAGNKNMVGKGFLTPLFYEDPPYCLPPFFQILSKILLPCHLQPPALLLFHCLVSLAGWVIVSHWMCYLT